MKKISTFLLIFMILFVFICSACDSGNQQNNDIVVSPKLTINFSNSIADLSGAKKLGIIQQSSNSADTVMMTFNSNYTNEDDSLVLVKIDEEENVEKVTFFEDNNGKIKDDTEVEIYKLYVVGNFTVMSFISSYWRNNNKTTTVYYSETNAEFQSFYEFSIWDFNEKYSRINRHIIDRTKGVPEHFDNTAFYNTEYIKSYIMDNTTGKIYGTENFEAFDIINGLMVVRKCDILIQISEVYNFFTDSSQQLVFKNVLPNNDVQITDAFKDNDGWVYVKNNLIEDYKDTVNKIIYFKDTAYRFASNGVVYLFGDGMPLYLYDFPIKEMKDGVASRITSKDFDFIYNLGYSLSFLTSKTFMKDGIYFYDLDVNYVTSYENVYWGKDVINDREINLNLYYDSIRYDDGVFSSRYSQDIAFYYKNNNFYYFDLNWSEVADGGEIKLISKELLLNGVQRTHSYWTIQNGYLTFLDYVFSKTSPTGTEYYQVKIGTNGKPVATLIRNNEFSERVIIIQPLN